MLSDLVASGLILKIFAAIIVFFIGFVYIYIRFDNLVFAIIIGIFLSILSVSDVIYRWYKKKQEENEVPIF